MTYKIEAGEGEAKRVDPQTAVDQIILSHHNPTRTCLGTQDSAWARIRRRE